MRTVFLGSILGEKDFETAALAGVKRRPSVGNLKDRSRGVFFAGVFAESAKPKSAGRGLLDVRREDVLFPPVRLPVPQATRSDTKIAFTVKNYSLVFDNLTFADIKGLLTQQELGGYMEFKARTGAGGRIDFLEKVVGSGDPLLDSYVARKIKNAILRRPPAEGARLKLYFRLRAGDDVPG